MTHVLRLLAVAGAVAAQAQHACDWPSNLEAPEDRISEIQEVCRLTNEERVLDGQEELLLDASLIEVAQGHAQDMVDRDYFSHESPEGWHVWDRLRNAGVIFTRSGENIARGQPDAAEVMSDWMASAGHRRNILKPTYLRIGVGLVDEHWVQVFTD